MEGEKNIKTAFCERLKAARPGLILAGVLLAWTYAVPLLIGLGLAWALKSAVTGKAPPSLADMASSLFGTAGDRLMETAQSFKASLQEMCRFFSPKSRDESKLNL